MPVFTEPLEGTIFYEDDKIYVCLAFEPKTTGHTMVVWKKDVSDMNDLSREDNLHLWSVVYTVRGALMAVYSARKVYIAYLDESNHVHVRLYPRRDDDEIGWGLMHRPSYILADTDFEGDIKKLKAAVSASINAEH